MVDRPGAGTVDEGGAAAAAEAAETVEGNEVGVAGRGKLLVVVFEVAPEADHGVAVELPMTLGTDDTEGLGKVGGGTLPPVGKVGLT